MLHRACDAATALEARQEGGPSDNTADSVAGALTVRKGAWASSGPGRFDFVSPPPPRALVAIPPQAAAQAIWTVDPPRPTGTLASVLAWPLLQGALPDDAVLLAFPPLALWQLIAGSSAEAPLPVPEPPMSAAGGEPLLPSLLGSTLAFVRDLSTAAVRAPWTCRDLSTRTRPRARASSEKVC